MLPRSISSGGRLNQCVLACLPNPGMLSPRGGRSSSHQLARGALCFVAYSNEHRHRCMRRLPIFVIAIISFKKKKGHYHLIITGSVCTSTGGDAPAGGSFLQGMCKLSAAHSHLVQSKRATDLIRLDYVWLLEVGSAQLWGGEGQAFND